MGYLNSIFEMSLSSRERQLYYIAIKRNGST